MVFQKIVLVFVFKFTLKWGSNHALVLYLRNSMSSKQLIVTILGKLPYVPVDAVQSRTMSPNCMVDSMSN
jgi:hypothetical protein